jgi:FkbM family methyltransferase
VNAVERAALALRHSDALRRATWLWDALRPMYDTSVKVIGRRGLLRSINKTDRVYLLPGLRHITESYEPDVWRALMSEVRGGDVVADVGAYIGLYTIALAQRVGPTGQVVAFEPDPRSFAWLCAQVELNRVGPWVELHQTAVAEVGGMLPFVAGRECESRLAMPAEPHADDVVCTTLDAIFIAKPLHILKIDVEGFEEAVLRGASRLLGDRIRGPRVIFIEVHPYAWPSIGVSDTSLLAFLRYAGYRVTDLVGQPVTRIERWGEIVARRVG